MGTMRNFKLGGKLLAVGAIIALVLKIYFLAIPNEYVSFMFRIIQSVLGTWLAFILVPVTTDGSTLQFDWISLLWIPWAAIFIILLLWIAIKVTQGRIRDKSLIFPLIGLLGIWLLIGEIYDRITNGYFFADSDLILNSAIIISDISVILMIIGIGLILFNAKNLASVDDEISQGELMSFTNILFSFRGRINRAKFWFYQVLILDMVILICVAVGAAISKDTGALAGYVIGCFLVVWPGLAIATKRCHDRNKSGAFILIALIPIIGIWYVVEVAFLKGTEGDNRYGSDPLMALNQNKNDNTVNEN